MQSALLLSKYLCIDPYFLACFLSRGNIASSNFISHVGPTADCIPTKKNATNCLNVNCASILAEHVDHEP